MARQLTAAFVRTVKRPGVYGDQHGLRLRVSSRGTARYWVWRGTIKGRGRVDLGVGTYPYVSLAEARDTAFQYRKMARAGGDPWALKRRPDTPSVADATGEVIALYEPTWKPGSRNAATWRSSFERFVFPRIGQRRIDQVTTADVMQVLLPIWTVKPETARQVRNRLSAVLKWAVAQGYRQDNPAGEAIGAALPRVNGGARENQRAIPHSEVASALVKIRGASIWGGVKLALEFAILTASRSGEVRGATWAEVDLKKKTWTVPASRMKAKREHRIPLSGRAVEVLAAAREIDDGSGLIFPSARGKVMKDVILSRLLRDLGIGCVPHGFRSSFRDWCAETGVAREVAEAALAHAVVGVEGAYFRSDLFEKRRRLMAAWGDYLTGTGTGATIKFGGSHENQTPRNRARRSGQG